MAIAWSLYFQSSHFLLHQATQKCEAQPTFKKYGLDIVAAIQDNLQNMVLHVNV